MADHEANHDLIARRGRYYAIRGIFLFITFLVLLLVLGLQTFLAIQDHHRIQQNEFIQGKILEQAKVNAEIGRTTQGISKRLLSCTAPAGKCYQSSAERTGVLIQNINEVSIVASACASGLPPGLSDGVRAVRTRDCVKTHLAVISHR